MIHLLDPPFQHPHLLLLAVVTDHDPTHTSAFTTSPPNNVLQTPETLLYINTSKGAGQANLTSFTGQITVLLHNGLSVAFDIYLLTAGKWQLSHSFPRGVSAGGSFITDPTGAPQ